MISRRRKSSDVLGISEAELVRRTAELDELHNDEALPSLRSSVQEWIEANGDRGTYGASPGSFSRRGLLIGTGAAALGGLVLAACSSGGTSSPTTSSSSVTGGPAALTGDLKLAALAASLENLGIFAYEAGIKAAMSGKLGAVPPAVLTFATTAMGQHREHAAAWNSVLTGAGKKAVTATDPALAPTVNQKLSRVFNVGDLANLALEIENIAAETYQVSVGALSGTKAIQTAASIQPVEMQHAAILNLILGSYPVPNAFSPTISARSTSDLSH